MTEFFIYLAITLLAVAFQKKPDSPRAALLGDLDVPVAEDGRPISVVFGTCRLKSPNVIWYGNLATSKIKKRSGFSKATVGFKYYLTTQHVFCLGPINRMGRIIMSGKPFGEHFPVVYGPGGAVITIPGVPYDEIWGGELRGGGFTGNFWIKSGHEDQTTYALSFSGKNFRGHADNNAYLGVVMVDVARDISQEKYKNAYIGNSEQVRQFSMLAERTFAGWCGENGLDDYYADWDGPYPPPFPLELDRPSIAWPDPKPRCWYPEKVLIDVRYWVPNPTLGLSGYYPRASLEMNPVHVIWECLTNPIWGMGANPALIDDESFRAAADVCYTECLGVSFEWQKQIDIDQFIDVVCDHMAGGLRFNETRGKYQIVLLRGDYNPDDLPLYNTSNATLLDYEVPSTRQRVNQVVLKYTNSILDDQTGLADNVVTITAQDLGVQQGQEVVNEIVVDRTGFRDQYTAQQALTRECYTLVAPLSKIKISVDRRARGLGYAGVFKYQEPQHHATPRIYRATKASRSSSDENEILIEAVADIFSQQNNSWIVSTPPVGDDTTNEQPDPNNRDDSDETSSGSTVITIGDTIPPSTPADGDTYIPGTGATGDWTGLDGQLVSWDATNEVWEAEEIPNRTFLFDDASQTWKEYYDGTIHDAPWRLRVRDSFEDPDQVIDDVKEIRFDNAAVSNAGANVAAVEYAPPFAIVDEEVTADEEDLILIEKAAGGYRKIQIGNLSITSGGTGAADWIDFTEVQQSFETPSGFNPPWGNFTYI